MIIPYPTRRLRVPKASTYSVGFAALPSPSALQSEFKTPMTSNRSPRRVAPTTTIFRSSKAPVNSCFPPFAPTICAVNAVSVEVFVLNQSLRSFAMCPRPVIARQSCRQPRSRCIQNGRDPDRATESPAPGIPLQVVGDRKNKQAFQHH